MAGYPAGLIVDHPVCKCLIFELRRIFAQHGRKTVGLSLPSRHPWIFSGFSLRARKGGFGRLGAFPLRSGTSSCCADSLAVLKLSQSV